MRFNLGLDEDYYSQRNNKYYKKITGPLGTSEMKGSCMCNVTVLCEALTVGGWYLPSGKYEQDEDNLCDFIVEESLKKDSYFAKHFPAMWTDWVKGKKDAYWPNEIHDVLAYETGRWLGCSKVDTFKTNVTMIEMVEQLVVNRLPIPISVKFGKLNHIVLLTGFDIDLDTESQIRYAIEKDEGFGITSFIYDDPYGAFDWKTQTYPTNRGSGNNQILSMSQFIENLKPLKASLKWAHILEKPASIV